MSEATLSAVVTVVVALLLALIGWYFNRRLGLPDKVQKTIREERAAYEQALEDKAARLETELETERKARLSDKRACLRKINRLGDMVIERDLIIERMQGRLAALDGLTE